MGRYRWVVLLAASQALGWSFTPAPASAQSVRYNGTLSYATGAYLFAERTHSLWLSNGLSLTGARLSASANLPLVLQNSGVLSVVAGQSVPTGGADHGVVGRRSGGGTIGTRRRDGSGSGNGSATDSVVVFENRYALEVGDPSLRVALDAHSGTGVVRAVTLSIGAKAPVRDVDSGVGTGAWDVGTGASAAFGFGRTWIFLDGAYWWFGDLPDLELQDGLLYSVGVSRLLGSGGTSLLATLSGGARIVPTADAPLSASLGVSRILDRGRSLSLGVSVGLSEASSDFSAYLGWSLPMGGT